MRFATDLGVSVWVWVPPPPISSNAICTGTAASCHLISQNHRITIRTVEVGRDLWWSAGPTLLIKQGYLEDHVSPQHMYRDFINYLIHHFVPEMTLNWLLFDPKVPFKFAAVPNTALLPFHCCKNNLFSSSHHTVPAQ